MATSGRCIAGVPWDADSKRLPQVVIKLAREEAWALHGTGRLDRLKEQIPKGVHVQLLEQVTRADVSLQPCLMITGVNEDAVGLAHEQAKRMLIKDGGLAVAVHPHDVAKLRATGCSLLEELERASGCRILVENHARPSTENLPRSDRQHDVRLLGDQAAQGRAVELLAKECSHPVRVEEPHINTANPSQSSGLSGFHVVARGPNVEIDGNGLIARRSEAGGAGHPNPSGCVVVGDGALPVSKPGAFFCVRVRRVRAEPGSRGGTRIGITTLPVEPPLPDSLLRPPDCCWVLGRGLLQGPDRRVYALPLADFDGFQEGDLLAALVTQPVGGFAVLRKRPSEKGWTCLVHWAAAMPTGSACHALLELGGRLAEVELCPGEKPPLAVSRAPDFPLPVPQRTAVEAAKTGELAEDLSPTLFGEKLA